MQRFFLQIYFLYPSHNDLKICNKEYESNWIEILNQKWKNVIIGCIYWHPQYDNLDDFGSYMKNLFLKLNKENKEVYICGDFNINLLKYDDEIVAKDFYNLMNSDVYLPQINLPTRITDTTMTLIDNIFTNTMNYNSFSINILIQIAEHLSQFLWVDTSKIEYQKLDIYKRDYSNFNDQSFIEDISIQNWHDEYDDPNDCYTDFIFRLEGCVNRHAPLKKT